MKYRYHFNDYLYPSMDYADYILKKYSPKTEHNVSVRGGNDFVKYYASVGYYSEDGLVKKKAGYGFNPNNEYRRLSLRTNLDLPVHQEAVRQHQYRRTFRASSG